MLVKCITSVTTKSVKSAGFAAICQLQTLFPDRRLLPGPPRVPEPPPPSPPPQPADDKRRAAAAGRHPARLARRHHLEHARPVAPDRDRPDRGESAVPRRQPSRDPDGARGVHGQALLHQRQQGRQQGGLATGQEPAEHRVGRRQQVLHIAFAITPLPLCCCL